jgi:hypothetical protein
MNGLVIDKSKADLGVVFSLALEDSRCHLAHLWAIDCDKFLGTTDGYLEHPFNSIG